MPRGIFSRLNRALSTTGWMDVILISQTQGKWILLMASQSVSWTCFFFFFEWAVCKFMLNCMNTLDSNRPQWIIWANLRPRGFHQTPFGSIFFCKKEVIGNWKCLMTVDCRESTSEPCSAAYTICLHVWDVIAHCLCFDSSAAISDTWHLYFLFMLLTQLNDCNVP